eukprot:m.436398 g.436398  ORF g.436398 m.436398 type:complete len:84 (-) comp56773_c0_seq15:1511-1762(-)
MADQQQSQAEIQASSSAELRGAEPSTQPSASTNSAQQEHHEPAVTEMLNFCASRRPLQCLDARPPELQHTSSHCLNTRHTSNS